MTIHVLVLIHGITPEERPTAHAQLYEHFWSAMQRERPELRRAISCVVEVEWGNYLQRHAQRPDTRLSNAERAAGKLVRYDSVKQHPGPNNTLDAGPFGDWNLIPGLRHFVRRIREELVQFGLADAIYYASEDGERAVRSAVYGQMLEQLRPFRSSSEVRLHVVAHSLGVTVAHDFLYGLFGKPDQPDFLAQANHPADREDYLVWRAKAKSGELSLDSFVSMASQLPLFALRKQSLVDRLAQGHVLDASAIGITDEGPVRWLILYDVDDVLGFATRELYGDPQSIRQVQVDVGDTPVTAHTGYWTSARAIAESAKLIADNTR